MNLPSSCCASLSHIWNAIQLTVSGAAGWYDVCSAETQAMFQAGISENRIPAGSQSSRKDWLSLNGCFRQTRLNICQAVRTPGWMLGILKSGKWQALRLLYFCGGQTDGA